MSIILSSHTHTCTPTRTHTHSRRPACALHLFPFEILITVSCRFDRERMPNMRLSTPHAVTLACKLAPQTHMYIHTHTPTPRHPHKRMAASVKVSKQSSTSLVCASVAPRLPAVRWIRNNRRTALEVGASFDPNLMGLQMHLFLY